MPRVAPVLLALFLVVPAAHASSVMAKYVAAVNGTTLKVHAQGKAMTVRMHGVATPDVNDPQPDLQRLGRESQIYLAESLRNQWVYVEFPNGEPKADANGVIEAYIYVNRGAVATFLNEKLVTEGLAIVNRRVTTPYNEKLLAAEETARASSRGMWGAFASGTGKEIAAGSQRQTYIGELQPSRNSYVSRWVSSYGGRY
ncbi:MAG TPA: thermonuclease family protein [Thermoanaerobaculia bacterium]